MKLTEEQLAQLIKESTEKILKEYAYHERQNKKADSEDNKELKKKYNEWMAKKNASKKAQSKKDDDDDKSAIDYYDYKHGRKGNFKPMKKESKQITASQLQNYITESVRRIVKEMMMPDECCDETRLDYDEDNFSGRWGRGTRYDILVDGSVYYSDVPEETVDRLCDDLYRRGYEDVRVVEN